VPAPAPNAAVRWFTAVRAASLAVKLVAIGVAALLIVKFLGGF
jgi:hypothetical protein